MNFIRENRYSPTFIFYIALTVVIVLGNSSRVDAKEKFITIYNNSNIDIWAESHRGGCSGICGSPGEGVSTISNGKRVDVITLAGKKTPVSILPQGITLCCGWTGKIIHKKEHANDQAESDTIGLNAGAPSWTFFYSDYPVYVYPKNMSMDEINSLNSPFWNWDRKKWKTKKDAHPGDVIYFPSDFNVSEEDLKLITLSSR